MKPILTHDLISCPFVDGYRRFTSQELSLDIEIAVSWVIKDIVRATLDGLLMNSARQRILDSL